MAAKPAARKTAKKRATKKAAAAPAKKPAPRVDKGEGAAAVQARIKTVPEPVRAILAKVHALVTKHAPTLQPTVKWGFAVYMRNGKMMLVAAPRKAYLGFGFTMEAQKSGVGSGEVQYRSVAEVDEAQVAKWAKAAAAAGPE